MAMETSGHVIFKTVVITSLQIPFLCGADATSYTEILCSFVCAFQVGDRTTKLKSVVYCNAATLFSFFPNVASAM